MTTTTATLEPWTGGSIRGDFFTSADRCGYRRGEQEVRLLLDDIAEAASGDYFYLQPVVVEQSETDRWELVDGQQRLAALVLILCAVKRFLLFTGLQFSRRTRDVLVDWFASAARLAGREGLDLGRS